MAQRIEEVFRAIAPRGRNAAQRPSPSGLDTTVGGTSLSPALTEAASEIARLREAYQRQADLISANTQALQTSQRQSTASSVASAASHVLGGGLGLLSPLVSGLASLFGNHPTPNAPLPVYTPPPPVAIDAVLRGNSPAEQPAPAVTAPVAATPRENLLSANTQTRQASQRQLTGSSMASTSPSLLEPESMEPQGQSTASPAASTSPQPLEPESMRPQGQSTASPAASASPQPLEPESMRPQGQSAASSAASASPQPLEPESTRTQVQSAASSGTSAASPVLGGGPGLLPPLVSGLFSLFGNHSTPTARLPIYTPPSPAPIDAVLRGNSSAQQVAPVATAPVAAASRENYSPQITVNVSAMDSRSFMDRSTDIANAVREAMLNNHPINGVISDL